MTRLRVASYNTRDFLDDRHAAVRIVRAIDPDVLCLQEVPRRLLAARRVAAFARECGMSWPGGHRGSGGTTVMLAPWVPLVHSTHHRLPTALLQRTRGFAVVGIGGGGTALTIVSIHLGLSAGERVRHTTRILQAVERLPGEAVVAGDLNETIEGAAHRLLRASLRVVTPDAATYPSARPRRRLDVILATAGVVSLPHADIPIDEGWLRAASDHLPTWVDLDVDLGGAHR